MYDVRVTSIAVTTVTDILLECWRICVRSRTCFSSTLWLSLNPRRVPLACSLFQQQRTAPRCHRGSQQLLVVLLVRWLAGKSWWIRRTVDACALSGVMWHNSFHYQVYIKNGKNVSTNKMPSLIMRFLLNIFLFKVYMQVLRGMDRKFVITWYQDK